MTPAGHPKWCECDGCHRGRLWIPLVVGVISILLALFVVSQAYAQEPAGERGILQAGDEAPCAVILTELAQHRWLVWMSPERFDFVLDQVEAGQAAREELALLSATAEAQAALVETLRARVAALESEQAARVELEAALRRDLASAERSVIRTPPRRKLWLAVGLVVGAGAALALEN